MISNDFDNVWNDVQILLTPTTLTTAPLHSDFVKKTNRDQCAIQDYCTQPANMAGNGFITELISSVCFVNFRCTSNINTHKIIKNWNANKFAAFK